MKPLLSLSLSLAVLGAVSARPETPDRTRESVEALFLLYALEEKSRDVIEHTAELREMLGGVQPTLRITTALRTRTARLRVHVDEIRLHLIKNKMSPEILKYAERLLAHLDRMDADKSLATRLEAIENRHEKKMLKLWKDFLSDEEEKTMQRVAASLRTGLSTFAESSRRLETSPLDDLLSGAIAGFGQQMALELVDLPRRRDAFARTHREAQVLLREIRPVVVRELTEELTRFDAGPSRRALEAQWAELVLTLRKRHDWPDAWVRPDLKASRTPSDRPHDPFVVLAEARQWLERPIKSSAQAKQCLEVAHRCFKTAEKEVPSIDRISSRYKADLFAAAGRLANRITEYEFGSGGLLAAQSRARERNPESMPPSVPLALQAWGKYHQSTPNEQHSLPGYLHQRGLALAYSGDCSAALKLFDAYLKNQRFPDSVVWLDAARIVAVLAQKYAATDSVRAGALNTLSLQCLKNALLLGEKRTAIWAVHPDFTCVRAKMKPQFEALLEMRPYAVQLLSASGGKQPEEKRPLPPPAGLPGRLLVKGSRWVGDLKTSNKKVFEGSVIRITARDKAQIAGILNLPHPAMKDKRVEFPLTGTLQKGEVNLRTGKPTEGMSKLSLTFTGRVEGPNLHLKGKGTGHAGAEITVDFDLKHKGP